MSYRKAFYLVCAIALCLAACLLAQQKKNPGYTDTAILPGQPWHVHDSNRPHPNMVQPGKVLGAPPSDATVLFDGTDLSRWMQRGRGADRGKEVDPKWKVTDGYFEVRARNGLADHARKVRRRAVAHRMDGAAGDQGAGPGSRQ